MTNLAKPAKMSNTAFFLPRCRFSRPFPLHFLVLLDFPRFSSILLDSPRFSSILLDSPRFSSILLDPPRSSSILLDFCSLARTTQILQHAPFFRHFPFLGAFLPHNWTFCTLLSHFPPKIVNCLFLDKKCHFASFLALCLKNLQHWSFLHKWTFLSVFPAQSSKTAGFCARTAILDNTG